MYERKDDEFMEANEEAEKERLKLKAGSRINRSDIGVGFIRFQRQNRLLQINGLPCGK